jgi:anti-anti-sigma factor
MAEISIEESDNTVIIHIAGEITMTTAADIDNACRKYIDAELKVAALDLRSVLFIDSFGISRVIKISKSFNAKGTDFVLINMNDNISQIFKIATFDKLFTIMTNDEFRNKYLSQRSPE